MNRTQKEFDRKFPGIRKEIQKYLTKELKLYKKIGFPDYDLTNLAFMMTKRILTILEGE